MIAVTVTVRDVSGGTDTRTVQVATTTTAVTHGVDLALSRPTSTSPDGGGPNLALVGATARGVTLSPVSGNVTLSTPGTYAGKHVSGQIIVRSTGVVIEDCQIDEGIDCRDASGNYFSPVVRYCTLGLATGSGNAQEIGIYHGGYTIERCLIEGFSDGLRVCGAPGVTATECYVRLFAANASAHCDGLQDPCGYEGDVTVTRCFVDAWDHSGTGAGVNAALGRQSSWGEGGNSGATLFDGCYTTSANKHLAFRNGDVQSAGMTITVRGHIFGPAGGAICDHADTGVSHFVWTGNTDLNGVAVDLP